MIVIIPQVVLVNAGRVGYLSCWRGGQQVASSAVSGGGQLCNAPADGLAGGPDRWPGRENTATDSSQAVLSCSQCFQNILRSLISSISLYYVYSVSHIFV